MLKTRLWTAAIALPAVLAAIVFAPDWLFTLFIALLGVVGLFEIAGMAAASAGGKPDPVNIGVIAVLGGVPLFGLLYGEAPGWLGAGIIIAVMLAVVAQVAVGGANRGPKGIALAVIGAAWVGVLFPYFALLRNSPPRAGSASGVHLIILMLLLVVASDTGAYFAGRGLGRTKLMPRVSPNKTVEGAVGGLLGSIVAGLILRPMLTPDLNAGAAAALSAVIAMLAQLGDLAGSAYKRSAGVKDSGWIFPGHGGLLDRTCSLVFAAVFTYYWAR